METLYPLQFKDILKDKIWGGRNLEKVLGKALPPAKPIGESWEISDHGEDTSIIAGGSLDGRSLHQAMQQLDEKLLGTQVKANLDRGVFPLLVKFLDASDRLSVQVHPDDAYAAAHEGPEELGKTECWYIIHAEPNAKLIVGVREGVTPDSFRQGIEQNELEQYLQEIPVAAGDFIFIPSGTLHAIMEGIVLCEIQQNSDTTYRVYDWGRVGLDGKPRDLHIQQSLDTIDFTFDPDPKTAGVTVNQGSNAITHYAACRYFAVQKLDLSESLAGTCDGRHFVCLCATDGQVEVQYGNGAAVLEKGRSMLLPAALGDYTLLPDGKCELIRSFVPDIQADVIKLLSAQGISRDKINSILK